MNPGSSPSLRPFRPRRFPDLVRVGSPHDGGYVLPRSTITSSGALLSLGVEANWEFEEGALALNPALSVTCVDGTTGPEVIRARALKEMGRALVRLRPVKFARMLKLLRQASAFKTFFAEHEFLPLMVGPRPGAGFATVPELLARVRKGDSSRWVLIKMDIEGAEYDSLAAAAGTLERVAGIVIEFHDLDRDWSRFEATLAALDPTFVIAHVHGNNHHGYVPGSKVPQTLELTLVNRALVPAGLAVATDSYPLPTLDRPCDRRRPDLALSFE
jgi:hypothetical protein